jgi:hypothetical protein
MGRRRSEAVARRLDAASQQIKKQFRELLDWWHAFATHTVAGVDAVNALDKFRDAEVVAGGRCGCGTRPARPLATSPSGAPHADMFQSATRLRDGARQAAPRHRDFVASRGLLIALAQPSVAGRSDESGDSAFAVQAESWLVGLFRDSPGNVPTTTQERRRRWSVARKFFDFLEVNAEDYWKVPDLELTESGSAGTRTKRRPRRDGDESKPGGGANGSFADWTATSWTAGTTT